MNTSAENIPDPRKEEDEDGSEDTTVPREIVQSPHPFIPKRPETPPEKPLAASLIQD